MWYPMLWAIGGDRMNNVKVIAGDKITSDFGYHYETEVMVLNELKEPEAKERRALANRLKPIIAAPPEMLTVNRKGLHPYEMPNRLFVLTFTNESLPITLDSDDRRWFCVWSDAPPLGAVKFKEMWDWYKAGGFEAVTWWLMKRDVSAFNPKAIPFLTEYKQRLIYTGMSSAESFIYHLIEKREKPFNEDIIAGPWNTVIKDITKALPTDMNIRIVQPALLHALKEAGWVDKGLCMSSTNPSKRHIFVRPEQANISKSQARDMVEPKARDNVVPIAG